VAELSTVSDPDATARELGLDRVSRIIAAGGDGTVHLLANVLNTLDEPPPLGIIPSGSANDFASALQLHCEPERFFQDPDGFKVRRVDLIELSCAKLPAPRIAINAVTAGLSTLVQDRLDGEAKAFWGRFSYARVAAEVFPEATNHRLSYQCKEGAFEREAVVVAICNTARVGGVPIGTFQEPSDGVVDFMLVEAASPGERATAAAAFAAQQPLTFPGTHHHGLTEWLSIESDPPLKFVVDGEVMGETPASFRVLPRRLPILVPFDRAAKVSGG
jgi:diacylglycerol kinase family enzyme